ncbi:MAG: hypothetical protein KKH77_02810 [Candidatus Omnitrophica bacterium]|nr:hypothetical protein [Candidatus Omnitrophota bacterium]
MITWIKTRSFIKNIWNGVFGIASEISLAFLFIAAGFVVCFFWWSFFK